MSVAKQITLTVILGAITAAVSIAGILLAW